MPAMVCARRLLAHPIEYALGAVLELTTEQEEEHLKESREHLVRPEAQLCVLHLTHGLEVP